MDMHNEAALADTPAPQLLPFVVRIHLSAAYTVASLPTSIKKRLPVKQTLSIRRGERYLYLESASGDLFDEIVKSYADRSDAFGKPGKVTAVIEAVDQGDVTDRFGSLPSWVAVHYLDPDVASPFDQLCETFIKNIKNARSRGIKTGPIYVHERAELVAAKAAKDAADAAARKAEAVAVVDRLCNTRLDALYPYLVETISVAWGSARGLTQLLDAAEEAYRDSENQKRARRKEP